MPDLDKAFRASLSFQDFTPGSDLEPGPDLRIGTHLLRHPGNAIGYRITRAGKSVSYITDTEHPAEGLDTALVRFLTGTDVMIYDASYTDEEYATRIGWGHSTWRAAADLADAAGVGTLVLFHHDPGHDDATMDKIAAAAEARRPGSLVAMEGMRLDVG
jgi:phosphoribosyl 1,2-cyclic phosphodiesterase